MATCDVRLAVADIGAIRPGGRYAAARPEAAVQDAWQRTQPVRAEDAEGAPGKPGRDLAQGCGVGVPFDGAARA